MLGDLLSLRSAWLPALRSTQLLLIVESQQHKMCRGIVTHISTLNLNYSLTSTQIDVGSYCYRRTITMTQQTATWQNHRTLRLLIWVAWHSKLQRINSPKSTAKVQVLMKKLTESTLFPKPVSTTHVLSRKRRAKIKTSYYDRLGLRVWSYDRNWSC